ncbi:MAG: hypothetical protein K1X57_02640 [Gemmataceae bacterium]|nr:hypothetical protein [Gemmataceae bacterium]
MRWFVTLVLLAAADSASAQEPHLEFVERLRQSGLSDLAADYLQRLGPQHGPDVVARLPLERAKTLVALADETEDYKKRDEKFNQARRAFETYLATAKDPVAAADARFELARALVRQGKYRVMAARRLESKSEKQDALARARSSFDDAAEELTRVESAWRGEKRQATGQAQSAQERRINELRFERGLLLVNKALTHGESTARQLQLRSADLLAAKKLFLTLSDIDPNDALSWRAYVEAGRTWLELDNAAEARKIFEAIIRSPLPSAFESGRIARFYELQMLDKDSNIKNRSADVVRGCDEWLARYRLFGRTPEGQGVQFLLATNLIQQAQSGIKPVANGPVIVEPGARQLLLKAERHLKELAQADGDYTRKATSLRADVLAVLMDERLSAGVERLNSFEECYLAAQVELSRSFKVAGENADAKRRQLRLRSLSALQRGQNLVTSSDDPKDVFTARILLSYVFLLIGDPYSAAVLGEHLAVANLGSPKGVRAAVYALQAYATILSESKSRGAPADEVAADTRRLQAFAERVLTNAAWKDEPETDAARLQLGTLFLESNQFRESVAMLADIKPSFSAYPLACYWLGVATQRAVGREQPGSPAEKKSVLSSSVSTLESLPNPTPGLSVETILASYQAKLQLANLLLLSGEDIANYDRVEKIGTRMKRQLPELMEKSDPAYLQLETEAERIRLTGLAGQAYLLVRARKYDSAIALLAPVASDVSKNSELWKASPAKSEPWFLAFLQTHREIAVLSVRANILSGKSDGIKSDIGNMSRLAVENSRSAVQDTMLRLVLDLNRDLEGFKKAGDLPAQKRVEEGLQVFLGELAKPTELTPEGRTSLAQGYMAVGRPDKAIELLTAIPPPADGDEAAVRNYRFARLSLARAYRLAKQFGQAKAILREILGTPGQKGWGFDSFEVRVEAISVLQDEGQFASAARMAVDEQNKLNRAVQEYAAKKDLVRKNRDEAKSNPAAAAKLNEQADLAENDLQRLAPLRERFFEYYLLEIRAMVRGAQRSGDSKAAETYARLATRLAKLERGQPDWGGDALKSQFRDLILSEPELRSKFTAAGGKLIEEGKQP